MRKEIKKKNYIEKYIFMYMNKKIDKYHMVFNKMDNKKEVKDNKSLINRVKNLVVNAICIKWIMEQSTKTIKYLRIFHPFYNTNSILENHKKVSEAKAYRYYSKME